MQQALLTIAAGCVERRARFQGAPDTGAGARGNARASGSGRGPRGGGRGPRRGGPRGAGRAEPRVVRAERDLGGPSAVEILYDSVSSPSFVLCSKDRLRRSKGETGLGRSGENRREPQTTSVGVVRKREVLSRGIPSAHTALF